VYADEEDDVPAPGDTPAGADTLRLDEPVVPLVVGTLGTIPEPTDGPLVGAGAVTGGTDGVVTVGMWIGGAGTVGVWIGGTGTGIGGGLGTVTVGTVGVGNVGVETVGIGTEVTVGTVSAGLAWG
jgi:hypothetical protein